jgi:LmbE family N-acetylglucosaminyl deacetylase
VDDRERAEEWLEKACAWNSYKATDSVAEVTILRPPADDSLAAEFAAVRREEREACAKVCEARILNAPPVTDEEWELRDCAAAIRAMKEEK